MLIQEEYRQQQAEQILKNVFGYSAFRPYQREIINQVLWKKHTLAIMPTGSGKSLCYQIPALLFSGITLVISPLISLMKDQIDQLTDLGLQALCLNSSLSYEAYADNLKKLRSGKVKLLYLSPEALATQRIQNIIQFLEVDCIAIDEAHCISEWGHDFRPEYRQIHTLRKYFNRAVILAMTATATPRVQNDIRENLKLKEVTTFVSSFYRKNLHLSVQPKKKGLQQTIQLLDHFSGQSGIIYCLTRKRVDQLSEQLQQKGYSVLPYHAGLSVRERVQNQNRFLQNEVAVIIATVAFGMGIHKSNVRFIVHFDLPKNMEAYYQQIGRAGRDGQPSHCIMLFSLSDIYKIKYFIKRMGDPHEQKLAKTHLEQMIQFAESLDCRWKKLLAHFGETFNQASCQNCDNCKEHRDDHQNLNPNLPPNPDSKSGQEIHRRKPIDADHLKNENISKPKEIQGYDLTLFEILRQKRNRLAEEYGLKPFVVCHNHCLKDMALKKPTSKEEMLKIERMGERKYAKYGKVFLSIIKEYLEQHHQQFQQQEQQEQDLPWYKQKRIPRESKTKEKTSKTMDHTLEQHSNPTIPAKRSPDEIRDIIIGDSFKSGRSIQEIMDIYGVSKQTVIKRLTSYLKRGNPLPLHRCMEESKIDPSLQSIILRGFEEEGIQTKEQLDQKLTAFIAYEDWLLLQLIHLCKQNNVAPN